MNSTNNYSVLKDVQVGDIIQFRTRTRVPEVDCVETAVVATKVVIAPRPGQEGEEQRGKCVQITYLPSYLEDSCQCGWGYLAAFELDPPKPWGKMEFKVIGHRGAVGIGRAKLSAYL